MARFKVEFTRTYDVTAEIEADSPEHALEMLKNNDLSQVDTDTWEEDNEEAFTTRVEVYDIDDEMCFSTLADWQYEWNGEL